MIKFNRNNFFPSKEKILNENLSILLGDDVIFNNIHNRFEIEDISSLNNFRENSILFLDKNIKIKNHSLNNLHIITNNNENNNYYKNITLVKDLNKSYNFLLNKLFYHEDQHDYKDDFDYINGSYISKYCKIDTNVEIGKNSIISRGVKIGYNSIIKNNVVIKNSIIGNNVIICDNSSIGTSGFGFDFKNRGASFLNPQIGIVIIEDNVHLGSCCTVDRGKIDFTYIGKNSMIDNMVHIAHNVFIGENACIAAQTGISGSVVIGKNVTIGGQAGFAGHIQIGDNVVIAAKSGVTKNIKDNSVVAGFPAIDIKDWKKNIIRVRKNGH
jgi:UDP-3-O-[3-hydroxymyristoyl] glucosamine N-acyltransferase